jgi:hypothetical protein
MMAEGFVVSLVGHCSKVMQAGRLATAKDGGRGAASQFLSLPVKPLDRLSRILAGTGVMRWKP